MSLTVFKLRMYICTIVRTKPLCTAEDLDHEVARC